MQNNPAFNMHANRHVAKPKVELQSDQRITWIIIGVLLVILVLAHFNSLWEVSTTWHNAQYSHGYLVPVFAAVLLWFRREPFEQIPPWQRWLGVGLITLGVVSRVIGTRYVVFVVDNLSFLPGVLGIFTLMGGLRCLRWSGPPICFLLFMYPLPDFLVNSILRPLQTVATQASTVALQMLGVEVYRDGNRILLDQMEMGVVDQCSGLRMVTIFVALAFAIAMIITHRPWWDRLAILLSAIPIAITVNIIRITLTGMLYNLQVSSEIANKVFHDWAGFIMMPMALGLLFLEMQILHLLFIDVENTPGSMISKSHISNVAKNHHPGETTVEENKPSTNDGNEPK